MKILHLINGLGRGGAEKLLVDTLPFYKKAGFEVELLQITERGIVPAYVNRLKEQGIKVHTLGARSVYDVRNIVKLNKFLKNTPYNLIHVHLFPAMYWVPLALFNTGKLTELIFTEHNTKNRRWHKWYFKYPDLYTYEKYSKIIAITEEVKQELINWLPRLHDKIIVINNGLDISRIESVNPVAKRFLLDELKINEPDSKLLLMTARFEEQKNQMNLIYSLKYLPGNYHILFAGTGSLEEECKLLVRQLGVVKRVHFLGFRTDVISLMKSVDINVLSSHYEGLSGVTLEALAAGRPFLGAKVSGIQNMVPDDRYLFDNNNPMQLAEKLQKVVNNEELAGSMIQKGQEFVRRFDIHQMIEAHITLYQSLSVTSK
jgi:glycosyltransferase involved in cell wall biosynthesis